MTKVVIVQPYIPQYRVPFFECLSATLAADDIELIVAAGAPGVSQAARHDDAELAGVVRLHERRLGVGARSVLVRSLREATSGADLIVLEQARRNLEAYPLLFGSSSVPVALWGHGKTTTRATRSWEHRWLDVLTKRADWFFAYTEAGRRYLVERGYPAEQISVVRNATDTSGLRRDRAAVTAAQRRSLVRAWRLTDGRTALFLGALDSSKRIGFMLAAAENLASRLPGFTLVVAGDGPLRPTIEGVAAAEPWLRYVGPVFGADKARAASVADVMLNPGRVGLTVVDSFALGLPMITTDWPGHAPEFDYLENGVNGVITSDSLMEYVRVAETTLGNPAVLGRLRVGCAESSSLYGLEEMVARFTDGLSCILGRSRDRASA